MSAGGEELREAMRRFPAGVAVATTVVGGRAFGVTVGSLLSLSLEPPLVGLAIGRSTQAHELFREAGGFALSLLADDQDAVAQHFARSVPPIALWEGIERRDGARGPLLDGALVWLECALRAEHEAGDHTFLVADVERVELGRDRGALVYRGGRYEPA